MSYLRNTTRLPSKTLMTNKWESHAVTNDLLERKTQALEGSLNKLKLTIHRNQTKSNFETYYPIYDKRMSQSTNHNLYNKPEVNLFSTKSPTKKQFIKCGQCEKDEAKMKCLECVEVYCANCFAHFHLRGALQRHRCILLSENHLSINQKKKPSLSADLNLREISYSQSKDNSYRKSTITLNTNESNESLNENYDEKISTISSIQWKQTTKRIVQKRELKKKIPLTIENSNKISNIEFNSSKITSDEKILGKKNRHTNTNNQAFFIQRSSKLNLIKKDKPKTAVVINIRHSLSDHTDLNDSSSEIKPFDDNLSAEQSVGIITFEENEEEERPITHISTNSFSPPNSSLINKDLILSRPNSIALSQQSLRSLLTKKSNDELKAIIDSQSISSRPSSSALKNPIKYDDPLPTTSEIPSINKIYDHPTSARTEKDKSSTHVSYINSATTTPRRHSPFSFTNSLNKTNRINSSSSRDTGDGGFFTDILPRHNIPSPIPPPPILECSTSNEWKHALENQSTCPSIEQNQKLPNLISLRKSSIECLSRVSSKSSVTLEETHHRSDSRIDDDSRPTSSLSSISLPISVTSSKPDFIVQNPKTVSSEPNDSSTSSTAAAKSSSLATTTPKTSSLTTKKSSKKPSSSTSTTKHSSSTTTPRENSSSSTTLKTSSPATPSSQNSPPATPSSQNSPPTTIIQVLAEDKNVTNDEYLQESMSSLKDKSLSSEHTSQSLNDLLKTSSMALITRDKNITIADLSAKKKTRRHGTTTISNDSSKFRKLEFSMGDGLKWQEASTESMFSIDQSSKVTSRQSSTPTNTIFAEQFRIYDNDDGRSSRTYQNVNDEQCFDQLRQELCSELAVGSSDEDTILNEQILKILNGTQLPSNEII